MTGNFFKEKPMRNLSAVFLSLFILGTTGRLAGSPSDARSIEEGTQALSPVVQSIVEAKALLKTGVDAGNSESVGKARDLFLNALMKSPEPSAVLEYYIALADFRLIVLALNSSDPAGADRNLVEGERYLESAMRHDPSFGEAFALYGYFLGLEIAVHPDRAMTLGMKSYQYFAQAEEKSPADPRVHLLRGEYTLYVPEAYGGGPDRALPFLEKAEGLFGREVAGDPLKPDWGKDELYVYLGLAYRRKNDPGKAREMLMKALAVNPDFGWAKAELAALDKSK
jgi:tetratricopeptide (TPR) repeat protein